MELMENGSVYDEIRRQNQSSASETGLDEATAIKYMRQATEGLVFLHEVGIFHRDLKCKISN